jgi:hypothetical protein
MWKDGPLMARYIFTDRDGDDIKVELSNSTPDEGFVLAKDGAYIPKAEAPALALAILEKSGWDDPEGAAHGEGYHAKVAVRRLRQHADHVARMAAIDAERKAKEAAEAADRAKLDHEAKTLYAASGGADRYWDSPSLSESGRQFWRNVARAARALHIHDRAEDTAPGA